jgi:hypothetical protein
VEVRGRSGRWKALEIQLIIGASLVLAIVACPIPGITNNMDYVTLK